MPSPLELSESLDIQSDHHAFNLAIWDDVLGDPWLAAQPGEMSFFLNDAPDMPTKSEMVPDMPLLIETI